MTTRNELATLGPEAIDRRQAAAVAVSNIAGGVSFASALEVMEFSKLMAVSMQAVPLAFRNNPGLCLAVVFQAVEWRMSPFQVANKAYVVNDRLAFESQLIHAVIEARAPLKGRLRCDYIGEGADLQCKVYGTFIGEDSPHEYVSPKFSAIPTKNSPLWKTDPQQQMFYFASRSWARKWAPDVLLGIYSKEEAAEMEPTPAGSGLHARLAGSPRQEEGHQDGHAGTELDQIAAGAPAVQSGPVHTTDEAIEERMEDARTKPAATKKKPETKAVEKSDPLAAITTRDAYRDHALAWISSATDVELLRAQWSRERPKRTDLAMSEDEAMLLEISGAQAAKVKALQKSAA